MTSKKRRQRGSRTHGGGTHKNRRGAGHRGGRGNAGRKKHEQQLHGPLGKHGFKRPEEAKRDVREVNVRELDEDAVFHLAEGVAEKEGDGFAIDARDVVEGGHEADAVKVLGGGDVRRELYVTADAFSDSARELIETGGGEARLSARGRAEAETDRDSNDEPEN